MMKKVTEEEIQTNFEKLITIIEKSFSGDRKEKHERKRRELQCRRSRKGIR